jgi:hypothetical protein
VGDKRSSTIELDPAELAAMVEAPELSRYALSASARRRLLIGLALSVTGAVTLAVVDPVFRIRLTIPAVLLMTVANVCGAGWIFAKRFLPIDEAFRLGYKAGRYDERRAYLGDL